MSALALRIRRFAIRAPRVVSPVLRWALLWGLLALLAVFFATTLPTFPTLAFFPLAGSVGLVALTRSPLLFLGAIAICTGFYVTITLEVALPVGIYALMALGLLALWIVAIRERAIGRAPDRVVLWPGLVLLMVACLGSLAWVLSSGNVYGSLGDYRVTWWFLFAAVLVAIAPWERFDERFARVLLIAALAAAAYTILRSIIGSSAAEEAFARQGGGNFTITAEGELRAIGGVGDAHGLGLLMAAALPFCFTLSLGWRGGWQLVAMVTFGACAVSLVLSDVRSGMAGAGLGLAAVVGLFFVARPLGSRRLLAALVGLLLCVGAVAGTIVSKGDRRDESTQRFQAILNPENDASLKQRRVRWRDTLNDIEKAPLGHGIGTAGSVGRKAQRFRTAGSDDVASSYLRIAYEQGLVWLALFLAALAAVLIRLVREALLGVDRERALLAIGSAGTLIAVAFQLHFESIYFEAGVVLLGWLIVGLGLRSATLRPRAAPPREAG